jgi:hypothetical protein
MDAPARIVRTLEHGAIAFVVRPRVQGAAGVQRFLMLLAPERGAMHRRIVVGKKRMPVPGSREREWAYVDRIAADEDELLVDLGPATYETKTRGVRHQPGARVVARGRYAILAHAEHTHLSYVLEGDALEDEDLAALNVGASGSIIGAVFNPVAKWSRAATLRYGGLPDDPAPFAEPSLFPDDLQERFGKKRFLPLEPALLDHEGAELVLIGAEDELRPELALAV